MLRSLRDQSDLIYRLLEGLNYVDSTFTTTIKLVKTAHFSNFNIGNWFGHKFNDQEYKWVEENGEMTQWGLEKGK